MQSDPANLANFAAKNLKRVEYWRGKLIEKLADREEGWFLMQTRWMLYLEDGESLKLFSTIPRMWLASGKTLKIENAVSYYGRIQAVAKCSKDGNTITCDVRIDSERKPDKVLIRLPCFNGRVPKEVAGASTSLIVKR